MSRCHIHHLCLMIVVGLLLSACGTPAGNGGGGDTAVQTAVAATFTAEAGGAGESTSSEATPEDVDRVGTRVAEEEAVAATLTANALPANTSVPPATEAPAATQPPATGPTCTVVSNGLNLRAGPGTNFDPPITVLPNGMELEPIGRDGIGEWLEVQVAFTNRRGWVSAGPQFVACNVAIATLPLGQIPPTPTSPPTSTAPPTQPRPTPTPLQVVVEPIEGGGNWVAQILHPDYYPAATTSLVFRVRAFDADVGNNDGDGIDFVDFFFRDGEGELMYQRREEVPAFCSFGGGEPDCNVWVFADHGYRWPEFDGQQKPIRSGPHTLSVEVHGSAGQIRNGEASFQIQLPPGVEPAPDLVARIVQIGPGSTSTTVQDALVFQVEAYNPAVGQQDGAGINNVDMYILDSQGREVYKRTENNAGYCAFSGGEPDCDVWVFADHNNEWPNGRSINSGSYTLRATVNARDGRHKTVETTIQISY